MPARGRRLAALVRHGHFPRPDGVASAHLPLPLSPDGRGHARDAGLEIARIAEEQGFQLDETIEASQLLRAHETATVIAETLTREIGRNFEVVDRDDMLERGLGSCANLRFDEIEALLAADDRLDPLPEGWRRIPEFRLPVPGAESQMEAGRRTAARIDGSLAAMPAGPEDRMRIFVAHGGCLRHASVVKGALAIERVTEVTMDYGQVVAVERRPDGSWQRAVGEWKERIPKTAAGNVEREPASDGAQRA